LVRNFTREKLKVRKERFLLKNFMIEILDEQKLVSACRKLSETDCDLAYIFRLFGTPPLWARRQGFPTLVHIILEQQVSVASAKSAFDKLQKTWAK
jgi:DNA-3-methyladenine glycosylase II